MSHKSNFSNSVRSAGGSCRQNSVHEKLHSTPSSEEKIKFAGEDSKDRLYEPKQNKKMVRVLTVVIYVFSVSLAAIILSLYYVFFWNPKEYGAKIELTAPESVGLRADNVTNRNSTALPRCLENHDRNGPRVEERVTFPFQLNDPFAENNTTEEDTTSNTTFASNFNDSEQTVTPTYQNIIKQDDEQPSSILLDILSNGKKNENSPNNT